MSVPPISSRLVQLGTSRKCGGTATAFAVVIVSGLMLIWVASGGCGCCDGCVDAIDVMGPPQAPPRLVTKLTRGWATVVVVAPANDPIPPG